MILYLVWHAAVLATAAALTLAGWHYMAIVILSSVLIGDVASRVILSRRGVL